METLGLIIFRQLFLVLQCQSASNQRFSAHSRLSVTSEFMRLIARIVHTVNIYVYKYRCYHQTKLTLLALNLAVTAVNVTNKSPRHQCDKIEEAHHVRVHRRLHLHHIRRRLFSHRRRHHLVSRPPITLIVAVPTNHKDAAGLTYPAAPFLVTLQTSSTIHPPATLVWLPHGHLT